MSNEIDVYANNDIAPYDPGMPVLAPLSPEAPWTTSLDNDERHPNGLTKSIRVFGVQMPPGSGLREFYALLDELGAVYQSDFSRLGYPSNLTDPALVFFKENANRPPYQVTPRHSFTLPSIANDYLGHAFCNLVHDLPGSHSSRQGFITAAITWLAKVVKQLQGQQPVSVSQTRTSPPSNSDIALASLSEKQFEEFLQHNENVKLRTRLALEAKYGQYEAGRVIATANNYLSSLSAVEQQHFQQFSGPFPWSVMSNLFETVEFLYRNAIGAANIPTSGAALANEIALCENAMRTNRAAWLKDDVMQSRYRELLRIRDGG